MDDRDANMNDHDMDEKDTSVMRFRVELEFVQCLSNPRYLNFLAQQGYFDNGAFMRYLEYLLSYWTRPEYARFLIFPQSLYFLRRLCEDAHFREELSKPGVQELLHKQQFFQWRFGATNSDDHDASHARSS